ncbi:Cytochrome P450 6B2 [Eumeta japonica]|uniref:unspecific monooxygenase n=1 Tax=Eumeta variegata TaxID=151549 RepID=A0A4C1XC81_EUMVA|nr:Cytochrome P450 6B2 [Eumeta japonica]
MSAMIVFTATSSKRQKLDFMGCCCSRTTRPLTHCSKPIASSTALVSDPPFDSYPVPCELFVIRIKKISTQNKIYWYGTKDYDYWEKRGVPHEKPLPFFGNAFRVFTQKVSPSQGGVEIYRKYPNERFFGSFFGTMKVLTILDPELIKTILVTDFVYFHKRGLNPHETVIEPMLKNLFFADGDLWRLLRQRMTPAFTTGKLKAMFPLIVERAVKVQDFADNAAKSGTAVDVRDLMARYTTDFIGACGFGINIDSLEDDESNFRKLGKRIFNFTYRDAFVLMLKEVFPNTFKNLNFLVSEIETTTMHLVQTVMKQRNYKPSSRNDVIDLLLALKEKGNLVGDSIDKFKPDGTPIQTEIELDDALMAAQVFVFFAAGFETSSSATSYTLHQLAFHPLEQKKVQDEIDEVLSIYNNKLCYDAIKEMKYLEMAFLESMRLFPSLGYLIRKCAKRYTIPGTNVTIDKGVTITIPVQALHMDEKYFEDPEKFIPERFSRDRIKDIKKYVYMPFGEGPRACIGERLGLMQSLAGLAALLYKFSVEPAPSSLKHPVSDPTSIITQNIKGGLPLYIKARA